MELCADRKATVTQTLGYANLSELFLAPRDARKPILVYSYGTKTQTKVG